MNHGKFAKAEIHFQKAAELSPRYAAPRNNLGSLCLAREELYFAAWHFERAAELAPFSPEPMINLGLVYERAGQLERAEESYRYANEIAPSDPLVVGNLVRVLIKSDGDPMEIHQLLKRLMFIDTRPDWLDWADLLLSTRFRDGPDELISGGWSESASEEIPGLVEPLPEGAVMRFPSNEAEDIRPLSNEKSKSPSELLPQSNFPPASEGLPNRSVPNLRNDP